MFYDMHLLRCYSRHVAKKKKTFKFSLGIRYFLSLEYQIFPLIKIKRTLIVYLDLLIFNAKYSWQLNLNLNSC